MKYIYIYEIKLIHYLKYININLCMYVCVCVCVCLCVCGCV